MEENKIELKDEELNKVSGGVYNRFKQKPIGFSFYSDSSKVCILKINQVLSFVNEVEGFSYKIDQYYIDEYCGAFPINYTDRDIDDFISWYGKPE